MRAWIADIKEGQSAFDNEDDCKKPHRIINGKIVINQRKNADKYTRQYWDKVGPCIHTRNDPVSYTHLDVYKRQNVNSVCIKPM